MFLQRFAHSYPLVQAILHLVAQPSWIRIDRPGTPEETAQKLEVASVDLFHRVQLNLVQPSVAGRRFFDQRCQLGRGEGWLRSYFVQRRTSREFEMSADYGGLACRTTTVHTYSRRSSGGQPSSALCDASLT